MFVMASCHVEMGTDKEDTQNKTAASETTPIYKDYINFNTKLEGQIYYNIKEIIQNPEDDLYEGYTYQLYDFRIYLLGEHHAYRIFPDMDGNFFITDVEPGTYQVIVKSIDDFSDKGGKYTYMVRSNIEIKEGITTKIGMLNPGKVYTEKAKQTVEDIDKAENIEDKPTEPKNSNDNSNENSNNSIPDTSTNNSVSNSNS
jgi:hypothetical protein